MFSGFLTGLTAGFAWAAPPSLIIKPVVSTDNTSQFTFQLTTPAPVLSSLPDGSTRVRLAGFEGRNSRPGIPDLPFQVFRVAIPLGAAPRLVVSVPQEYSLPGVKVASVPRQVADVPVESPADEPPELLRDGLRPNLARRDVYEPDPSIYHSAYRWPEAVAAIEKIGIFRDQRYVEVRVTPIRLEPRINGLAAAASVTVTVRFDATSGGPSTPEASRFEDVYRRMFVNYAQGTTFRIPSNAPAAVSATVLAPTTGPLEKIRIRKNGVVRLDAARISASGFASQPISTWKLMNRGVEVPIEVWDANANDLLDPGDWIEFYGQASDDEPKTTLVKDLAGTTQDIFEVTDTTDENVYFLSVDAGPRARMAAREAAATNLRTPPTDFSATAHAEVDDTWRPLNGNDPWYWGPSLDSSGGTSLRTDTVALPGLTAGASTAHVVLTVRGLSEDSNYFPDHRTRVTLFNASSQTLAINDDNGTFDGRMIYAHDFTWTYPGSGAVLTNPVLVRLQALPNGSANLHEVILNAIDVTYRRSFQAAGDTLTFDWPDGDAEFVVSGLMSSAPEVWEITGQVGASAVVAPVRLSNATITGTGPYTVRFRVDDDPLLANGTLRRFVVFGSGAPATPADPDFQPDTVSDLRSNAIQADMIVIAHPSVLGTASQATLNELLAWRLANQGITSKVAMIDDVYDEFNYGLAEPKAIRQFLQWVMSTAPGEGWASPKPSYVMILGDSSYDFKAGTADGTFVPTAIMVEDDAAFGYYASESSLAAVVGGDTMPDLAVGRISVRNDADCNAVLQKILTYEQSPPAGNWQRHAVFVSDRGKNYDPNEALEFESVNDGALANMKTPPHTWRRMRYWTDYCLPAPNPGQCNQTKAGTLRADIKAAINGTDGISDGASILQYVGHGNFDVWSDDAVFDNRDDPFGYPPPGRDTDYLTNSNKLPFLIAHNCLTGGFMGTSVHTLGEDFANRASGGAVALFAPSGLSYNYLGDTASATLWADMFGPHKERELAVPVMDVYSDFCISGAIEGCLNYVFLGDPATRAVFPAVGPAMNVTAVAGNARVDLSWTASTTSGARYDVWRSVADQTSGYTKVGALVTATTFADASGLSNAHTYYYYVVAEDISGFESRWSNFNSDCAVAGPDCLSARPLNPNPPAAPTGVTVTDPETGGKLNVSWTVPTDPELSFYTVKWGTQSGAYTNSQNAGKNGFSSIVGLQNGHNYYIVVTKTSTSNLESAPSTEVTGSPSFVRGVRAPEFISSLQIAKSGANAVLTWGVVTTDIYGKPATIASYEVYRGTTPTFVPGPANRVGTPTTATFTDQNALSLANPNYYYLVRAVDASGNVGGLGNQLPNGIDALALTKTPDGSGGYNLSLGWPAVTMDFDLAFPVVINHYEVYGTDHVFSRADIRDGLVPLLASPTTNSWSLPAPATNRYFSVIAVDARGNKSSF